MFDLGVRTGVTIFGLNRLLSLLLASCALVLSIFVLGESFFPLKILGEIRRSREVIVLSFAVIDLGARLDVEALSNRFKWLFVSSSLGMPKPDRFGLDAN